VFPAFARQFSAHEVETSLKQAIARRIPLFHSEFFGKRPNRFRSDSFGGLRVSELQITKEEVKGCLAHGVHD